MHTAEILTQLRAERDRLDQAIAAIVALGSTRGRRGRAAGVTTAPKRRRRRISAAARAKLSRLMRQRWAQGKMKAKAKAA